MSIFSIIFMEKGGRKCPHALSAAYTSIHLNHFFSLIHASFRFLLWFPHWFVSLCHTFLIQCQLFHDRHSLCVRFFLLLRFYIIENTVNLVIIYLFQFFHFCQRIFLSPFRQIIYTIYKRFRCFYIFYRFPLINDPLQPFSDISCIES